MKVNLLGLSFVVEKNEMFAKNTLNETVILQ